MIPLEVLQGLAETSTTKIVLVVIDGLGGIPNPENGKTELESANIPNLNALSGRSVCGLIDPVGPGITPGSGAGHLALFGYDPIRFDIGRGALSAFGLGFDLQPNDVAARANFATVDENGNVTDRRAGRIPSEVNRELLDALRQITIPGVEIFLETESAHRALVVFRGEGLADQLTDTDPLLVGHPIKDAQALVPEARHAADVVNTFWREAAKVLKGRHPANALLLRGFAKRPAIPTFQQLYKLNPAAVAGYPMYRGVARLVGMEVLTTGGSVAEEVQVLRDNFQRFDYFFLHVKYADAAGEDGDFARKVSVLEDVDAAMPGIVDLKPDVLVVTGDHSTPAVLKNHSWHPVPFMLNSPWVIPDRVSGFSERAVLPGSLGRFRAAEAMALMLGYAQKLSRYGA
ncbi:MAG: 2,3-bisphosphoglycerate-independent phosphoglycerate mutase [Chloroflexota bacterium]